MTFRYQVLDKKKQLLQGQIDADSLNAARLSLVHQGYEVLILEEERRRFVYRKPDHLNFGHVPLKEKVLFVKHLALMIHSGLILDEALEVLLEQSRGKMKAVLGRILSHIRKGGLLSDALASFPFTFNEFFVNMIRIGENSGNLESNLNNLSIKLRKDYELRSKIKSAMMYPLIVIVALGVMGILLSITVLPKLLTFFDSLKVDIPFVTRVFIVVASFATERWYVGLMVCLTLAAIIFVVSRIKQTRIVIHWLIYSLPLTHQFSKASNLATFCGSFGLLLKSGITIDDALQIMTRAMPNVLYQRTLTEILVRVNKGEKLSMALADYGRYYPPLIIKMAHVGELSGNLSETFEYLAEFHEDELDYLSKNLSVLIEPVLLLFIGIVVAFMALAIISPIYQLTGGIA